MQIDKAIFYCIIKSIGYGDGNMVLQESGEMYLETIYVLRKSKKCVKSVDIVEKLGYSKSSVSRGVNLLKDAGYITIDVNNCINFTELGIEHTENLYEKHKILTECLVEMGVSVKCAENDACRMEHIISEESFQALKMYFKK